MINVLINIKRSTARFFLLEGNKNDFGFIFFNWQNALLLELTFNCIDFKIIDNLDMEGS